MAGQRKNDNLSQAKRADRTAHKQAPVPQGVQAEVQDLERIPLSISGPLGASPVDVLTLQRMVGNHAISRLIQAKLKVGPAGDQYEQEADRVAEQVLSISMPTSAQSGMQRQEEEEDLQMQPDPHLSVLQRQQEEEDLQMQPDPHLSVLQRQEEEENLQMQPDPHLSVLQRQEEEEDLQMQPDPHLSVLQRQEEEEDLQMQTDPHLSALQRQEEEEDIQMQPDPLGGFEVSSDLESRLASSQGSGSPLPENVRRFMEPRFGADFSGVRVHAGTEATELSRSLSAQAFTHGQDIYMGAGKYDTGSIPGNRLLAHELTHVLQQTGGSIQRKGENKVAIRTTGPMVQRKLNSRAERAFKTAIAQNGSYSAAKDLTDQHVPVGDQAKLVTLRGAFARILKSPGPEKLLKDFIRAYLLKNYAQVLADPNKTRGHKFYLGKALEQRDQYKSLISKGVTAPETQSWLRSEGFDAGIDVQPGDLTVGSSIDVRSTFIAGRILGKRVRAHLFIVYTASNGRQYYFRGGPSGGHPSLTVADWGEYTPGTVDWDPSAPRQTVLKGEAAGDKLDALIEATSVIDGMKVPYEAGGIFEAGENCNATAYTILKRAGIPTNKPSGVHPGWGHILGALTKGKENALPAQEDLSGAGEKYQIKGTAGTEVQVYKDRGRITPSVKLKGQTPVGLLGNPLLGVAAIKYDTDKVGFVSSASIEKRREAGRAFTINTNCELYRLTDLGVLTHLSVGDRVEVLDPKFEAGSSGNLITVGYDKYMGDNYLQGRVTDWYLDKV